MTDVFVYESLSIFVQDLISQFLTVNDFILKLDVNSTPGPSGEEIPMKTMGRREGDKSCRNIFH